MGDRCYLEINTAAEWVEVIEKATGEEPGKHEPGLILIEIPEANYGLYDELRDAASKGAVFYGFHNEGGNYGANRFLSDGTNYYENETGFEGQLVIEYREDLLEREARILGVRCFAEMEKRIKDRVAKEAGI